MKFTCIEIGETFNVEVGQIRDERNEVTEKLIQSAISYL